MPSESENRVADLRRFTRSDSTYGRSSVCDLASGQTADRFKWRTTQSLRARAQVEPVLLPTESANITTVVEVPDRRWILWTQGPTQGPAVRFWTLLVCALGVALVLGQLPRSPLRRYEWILLALGLTQVHAAAGLIVVAWLFLLERRGRRDGRAHHPFSFNMIQLALVMLTFIAMGILIVIVGEGLLGDPKMFILGNGSYPFQLRWFLPHTDQNLPQPTVISLSIWYYRLLMLLWALWLATAVLRWLTWGWQQYSHGGAWIAIRN